MKEADRNALFAVLVAILIGLGLAIAGSQGGGSALGIPIFGLSVGLAFLIQWLAFVPAYLLQSERFYDLTGGVTYTSVTIVALLLSQVIDGRSILLTSLVVVWAARHEMARTVDDVLARRTRALLLDARAAMEAAPAVAAVLAAELGRDSAWARDQVEQFHAIARHYLPEPPSGGRSPSSDDHGPEGLEGAR